MRNSPPPSTPGNRAVRNVIVLTIAHAVLGAQMPMIFVIGGLAGQSLASNACWATLPISLIVFGSMTTAPWLSGVMQRFGRRIGFMIGSGGGIVGAILCSYALSIQSFALFLAGSYFTGMYLSAQGFYRFAATDTASREFMPKAISYVMAGGLAAAVIGPQLVKITSEAMVVPFLGTYMIIIGLNLFGFLLFAFIDIPKPPAPERGERRGRSVPQLLADPRITVAIICAMVSYSLMNLVMTATPLAVVGCGYTQANAADVVMAHVLAMFAPAFFTGHLIQRFGTRWIISAGLAALAAAGAVALSGTSLLHFFAALILLGLGWNFGFIGATAMLAASHTPDERGRAQGLNDMIVFGCMTLGSLASGGLMNCAGGSPVEGWSSVNYAMAPFLALAGGSLIWIMIKGKDLARRASP